MLLTTFQYVVIVMGLTIAVSTIGLTIYHHRKRVSVVLRNGWKRK